MELLLIALECVVNVGTAHVWAKPGALGVTSSCAEIFRACKGACNQKCDWDQNSVQHSFFNNLFILIIIVLIIIHYNIRENSDQKVNTRKKISHKWNYFSEWKPKRCSVTSIWWSQASRSMSISLLSLNWGGLVAHSRTSVRHLKLAHQQTLTS